MTLLKKNINNKIKFKTIIYLLLVNFFYASVSIATKFTSQQEFLSLKFCSGVVAIIVILGIYAIIWQQVLKRIELTTAYMFKGTSLIFVLMFSSLIFGEGITLNNIIGSAFIIIGIALFAKA